MSRLLSAVPSDLRLRHGPVERAPQDADPGFRRLTVGDESFGAAVEACSAVGARRLCLHAVMPVNQRLSHADLQPWVVFRPVPGEAALLQGVVRLAALEQRCAGALPAVSGRPAGQGAAGSSAQSAPDGMGREDSLRRGDDAAGADVALSCIAIAASNGGVLFYAEP
ncbi:hypothetical protein HBH70_101560 [Parastagonospora nodorum]|uniref:Uncharacterized protein n=1 Tax=Phaeosphaeria nodorum (strain SN15 / ATCC MYA-4574 / FGSC 10173) TaxID=321614 RepID=A0A7U2FE90_PHANO|nr:hypothetical protein HBH42_229150 [Parastagonospora nodorum]QRD03683.1 hypothetical protein JI435_442260 [Parastagonospora nodorum SN15]KAH4258299.1 hypothetical protein HBI04_218030 [Parastagonospora nodorum]KAH4287075.1 hypothetical protein HBI01_233220 [Parastagonospora nodorum]KAH4294974.1 hypothetical protein HBI02_177080 [Parastagonospora nodorum]